MVIDFQIKDQYETYRRTPDEIATELNLEVEAVKAKLLQVSALYRERIKEEGGQVPSVNDFTDEQLEHANRAIYETMLEAELPDGTPDYRTRLKAATYIRDDKKGRKELKHLLQATQFNILNFNEALQNARKGADKAKQIVMPQTVEV